jgi:hypothetical protein
MFPACAGMNRGQFLPRTAAAYVAPRAESEVTVEVGFPSAHLGLALGAIL